MTIWAALLGCSLIISMAQPGCRGPCRVREEAPAHGTALAANDPVAEPQRAADLASALAEIKGRRVDRGAGQGDTVKDYLDVLIRGGQLQLLAALDEELGADMATLPIRATLRRVLVEEDQSPGVRQLLERLALRDLSDLSLAPYRTDGLASLVGVLESRAEKPNRRRQAAFLLGLYGSTQLLPRLERLAQDPTPVDPPTWSLGREPPTLGAVVRRAMWKIRVRSGEAVESRVPGP